MKAAQTKVRVGLPRVGLLGGGQLAQMLAESALKLGLEPVAYVESAEDPATQICSETVVGKLTDHAGLERFFAQVEHVVFENEFVDVELLRAYASQLTPSLDAIFTLQDKLRQKELLARLKIPTARHLVFSGGDLEKWLDQVEASMPSGFVLKWAQLGYDGKGTWISPGPGGREFSPEARRFCEDALARGVPLFAEEKISFKRELAMIACFSTSGEFKSWPLVISEQEKGVCRKVTGPAKALGVSTELESQAQDFAAKIAHGLPIHGVFALEMFETAAGGLVVNELAPRVHNTGHYTQDASETSQFENHWRAVLGMPLGSTRVSGAFAMLNLLGPPGISRMLEKRDLPVVADPMRLHWYDKKEIRPGRKMGHVNVKCESATELVAILRKLGDFEKEWSSKL